MVTYAYYSPPCGTFPDPQPEGMPPGDAVVNGVMPDIVLACDLGRTVVGVVNGAEAWRCHYPCSWPRALDIFQGLAFIGADSIIRVVNPITGYLHRTISVPNPPGPINGLKITRWGEDVWVALCFDRNGSGSVRGYKMTELELTLSFTSTHVASNPRDALVETGWMFVADTCGHRVYAIDLESGARRHCTPVYFPNHLQALAPDRILITAEHENRVFEWNYYPIHTRTMIFSAPVEPFNDISKTAEEIKAAEKSTIDQNSILNPKASLCAIAGSGNHTLYSPNAARLYGNHLLACDTDNHRVVYVDVYNRCVIGTVTNLNNPTNAVRM